MLAIVASWGWDFVRGRTYHFHHSVKVGNDLPMILSRLVVYFRPCVTRGDLFVLYAI